MKLKEVLKLDEIANAIGNLPAALDSAAALSATYFGYLYKSWPGAGLGLISYMLATRGNSEVAAASGVAGLSIIGASLAAPDIQAWVREEWEDIKKSKNALNLPYPEFSPEEMIWKLPWEACPTGYIEPRFLSTRCIRREAWNREHPP